MYIRINRYIYIFIQVEVVITIEANVGEPLLSLLAFVVRLRCSLDNRNYLIKYY